MHVISEAVILEMLVLVTFLYIFTKQPIDCLNDNIVERLKVSYIERSFDSRIYESNTQNDDLNYLPFDGDERLGNKYIVYIFIISYLGETMVQSLTYKHIK